MDATIRHPLRGPLAALALGLAAAACSAGEATGPSGAAQAAQDAPVETSQEWSFGQAPPDTGKIRPDAGWKNPFGEPHGRAPGSGHMGDGYGRNGVLILNPGQSADFVVGNADRRNRDKRVHMRILYMLYPGGGGLPLQASSLTWSDGARSVPLVESDQPDGAGGWRVYEATFIRRGACPRSETVTSPRAGAGNYLLIDRVTITTRCYKSGT